MTKRSRRHRARSGAVAPLSYSAMRYQMKHFLKPVLMKVAYESPEAACQVCNELLSKPLLILDIEANGARHASEIVEIGLIDEKGETVFHSLVRAKQASTPHAFAVHGIPQSALSGAPAFEDIWPTIKALLLSRPVISFDIRSDMAFLTQTLAQHQLLDPELVNMRLHCAMQLYRTYSQSAQCIGLKQALMELGLGEEQRHRVLDDCRLTLALLIGIAQRREVNRIIAPVAPVPATPQAEKAKAAPTVQPSRH